MYKCVTTFTRYVSTCLSSTSETEKYAHVTFFFNGGREQPFDLEDRRMIPSPKVPTYDLQPEMSADGVGKAVCELVNVSVAISKFLFTHN